MELYLYMSICILKDYFDYSYIMYVLCDKASIHYARIKNIVNIPIIICSTSMSILNTTEFSKETIIDNTIIIRFCTIVFSFMTAVSIAILNVYKITEKEFSFKSLSVNFLKIHNKIDMEIKKHKNTNKNVENVVIDLIKEYNSFCESMPFHIPSSIQKKVSLHYINYKFPHVQSYSENILSVWSNNNENIACSTSNDISSSSICSSSDSSTSSIPVINFGLFAHDNDTTIKKKTASYKTSPLRAISNMKIFKKPHLKKNSFDKATNIVKTDGDINSWV